MAERETRTEATHRQRSMQSAIPMPTTWPHDADGLPMAIVVGTASDLVPTVQFGNVLVGPVAIMRPVANGDLEQLIKDAQETQKAAEFVCGSERRLIQWATDPSTRIQNPANGTIVTPQGDVPAPPDPPNQPPVQAQTETPAEAPKSE